MTWSIVVVDILYFSRTKYSYKRLIGTFASGQIQLVWQYPDPLQPIEHRRWSPDMSASQHIGVGEQTCDPCRLPSKFASVGEPIGAIGRLSVIIWRRGADVSAPQQIAVGEPTGRFPSKLAP